MAAFVPCSIIFLLKTAHPCQTPKKLTSKTFLASLIFTLSIRPLAPEIPALLISMLTSPKCSTVNSANSSTLFRSVTSRYISEASIPRSVKNNTASFSLSFLGSPITIFAPSLPSAFARAKPIPVAPPVIAITLSFKFLII